MVKARITQQGAKRQNMTVGTIVEFDETVVNQFGCVRLFVVVDSKEQIRRLTSTNYLEEGMGDYTLEVI